MENTYFFIFICFEFFSALPFVIIIWIWLNSEKMRPEYDCFDRLEFVCKIIIKSEELAKIHGSAYAWDTGDLILSLVCVTRKHPQTNKRSRIVHEAVGSVKSIADLRACHSFFVEPTVYTLEENGVSLSNEAK